MLPWFQQWTAIRKQLIPLATDTQLTGIYKGGLGTPLHLSFSRWHDVLDCGTKATTLNHMNLNFPLCNQCRPQICSVMYLCTQVSKGSSGSLVRFTPWVPYQQHNTVLRKLEQLMQLVFEIKRRISTKIVPVLLFWRVLARLLPTNCILQKTCPSFIVLN